MDKPATRDSWDIIDMPDERRAIPLAMVFSSDEFEKIRRGFVPEDMDDRWFVYFKDGRLHLHRSWTGHEIFQIRIVLMGEKYQVVEAWANRDPNQYSVEDTPEQAEADADTAGQIIRSFLLHPPRD